MPSNKRDRSSISEGSPEQEKATKKTKVPKALQKHVSGNDLDKIRIYVLTRLIDDTSDDNIDENWKKVDYRVLKNVPNYDDEEDEEDGGGCQIGSEPEIVERVLACNINQFNSGLSDDTEGVENVRVGFLLENNSSIDVNYKISFGGDSSVGRIVRKNSTSLLKEFSNANKGFSQDFIISKSKMASDESEVVNRELLDKLGLITVTVERAVFTHKGTSKGDSSEAKSSESSQLKIKESMIKTGAAMTLNFGEVKQIQKTKAGGYTNYFDICEKLMNIEIKYRNYIGYLVELARANVPIEQKSTNTEEQAEETIEIIESEDDEDIEETAPPTPEPVLQPLNPNLTPFKSQSVMSKVKETVAQVEAMSTEDLIKFIKLIDEKVYLAVKDPFKNESIDGSSFLALSAPELKELGIKIGEQIKIKQIIQQVREN